MPIRFPDLKMAADMGLAEEVSDTIPNRGMIPGAAPIVPEGSFIPGPRYDVIPRDDTMDQLAREAPPQALPKWLESNPGRAGRDIEVPERVVPRQEEPVQLTPEQIQRREQIKQEFKQRLDLLTSGYKLLEALGVR